MRKETVTEEVQLGNGNFMLLINDGAYEGNLEYLKDIISEYLDNGGDTEDCKLFTHHELRGVEIDYKFNVKVEMEDEEYEEEEKEYIIRNNFGNEVESYYYEPDALDELAELISTKAEEVGISEAEDYYGLEVKTRHRSTYSLDVNKKVEIYIPAQEKEVLVKEVEAGLLPVSEMTDAQLSGELMEMYKRLDEISAEKAKRAGQ
jgi:hypothetical protein